MLKMNGSGLVVLTAVVLGSALGLATAPSAQAQDVRVAVARQRESRPDERQRGPEMVAGAPVRGVHVAQARGGAGQRRSTSERRSSAVERRDDKKPAQMRRDVPTRGRAEVERGGNGTPRSR